MSVNQFVLNVATVNGSGSQSSNNVLVRSLFRMGLAVGGKNMFPSNIAGLPTWYTIRVDPHGYTARKSLNDIVVAMNDQTIERDQETLKEGGFLFYNSDLKFADSLLRKDIQSIGIPFRELVTPLTKSVKLKKLLTNMVYAGVICEMLSIEESAVTSVIADMFKSKPSVVETNVNAIQAGRTYARENLSPENFPYKVQTVAGANDEKLLIDGNAASAIGLLDGGCTFAAWYPITPSSSLVETFEKYAKKYRVTESGQSKFCVVQGEDELSSICMVLGAGWAGARAMTATSGPGLSLMSEAAGLSYFAEIPAVIWDVQRVGPSTGLPTRTMQGDLLSAYTLSHGDTKHVVLLPRDPKECFEFGQVSFDLAEQLQTLVIVLSDLDIGMNHHIVDKFEPTPDDYKRGKVLNANDLEKLGSFARYEDKDNDGIGYRTLPGTEHDLAAYFTRGTGHDIHAKYSESSMDYKENLDRLTKKLKTAATMVPQPETQKLSDDIGILYYGSTSEVMPEFLDTLNRDQNLKPSTCRVKALPLGDQTQEFLKAHKKVFVIDQNRDGQMHGILSMEFPEITDRLVSIRQYNGLPLEATFLLEEIKKEIS